MNPKGATHFDRSLFAKLSLGFVVFTILGTLSHECGHYLVAKWFGRNASVHYAYTMPGENLLHEQAMLLWENNREAIELKKDFPAKKEFEELSQNLAFESRIIFMGGPLQTVLTGTIAFLFLFGSNRKKKIEAPLTVPQWLLVFLSLFWLRQLANLATSVGFWLYSGQLGNGGDEKFLSRSIGLNPLTLDVIGGTIAAALLMYIVFRVIPTTLQLTFVLSGLLGGVFGFWLWMYAIGPIVLP
jgi:hypothetical protein